MRIGIAEDAENDREHLAALVQEELALRSIQAEICTFASGEAFLSAVGSFDWVFLDVYMPGLGGIETARVLRKRDKDCLLVFVTSSADHALEAFQVRAVQYLVKPVTKPDIAALLDEMRLRLPKEEPILTLKTGSGILRVCFCDLLYAEHFSHQIYIHTVQGRTPVIRRSLGEFTALLRGDVRFFLCNRGIVVNLEHAVDFDGKVFTLTDGTKIPVSRSLVKNARQAFMEVLFRGGL